MSLVGDAALLAVQAHNGQLRKYTQEPYIVHPAEVVAILKTVPHSEEMEAAAWLHDVVEDTPATIGEIHRRFGTTVRELVAWLTDISRPEDGNRATRKAIDRAWLAAAPPEAQTIKLADVISNTRSITKYDPDFARVYLVEKWMLLDVLRAGDTGLWQTAEALIVAGAAALDVELPGYNYG